MVGDAGRVLVVGGTGTVGRVVVARLLEAGVEVRVLSRGGRPNTSAVTVIGDLRSGAGLAAAVADIDTIVICAHPVQRLLAAASAAAGRARLVYLSIVGVDRVPLGYYRRKLADEKTVAESGLPWTILRTTQFHDLVAAMLRVLARPPVMPVPAGFRFQPVDVSDVAARLTAAVEAPPAGRLPDLGGPQVLALGELARRYLSITSRRRPIVPVPVPGRVARAYRAGWHLTPDHAGGVVTFDARLAELCRTGTVPYGIGDLTRRPVRGRR